MAQLKIGLIGASAGIADSHLKAIARTKVGTIVGMADVAPKTGTERAQAAGCPFFTDHKEMLAKTRPDLVSITTPHPFHPQLALDAFAAGAHVLTEKPLAVDVAEADRMIDGAKKAGKLLAVNFQKQFWGVVEHMKRLLDEGAVGPLIRVLCLEPWYRTDAYYKSATWRGTWKGEGGGVLMNQAPHTMDLICHLTGLPKKVWGWARTRFHPMECEDSAQAMFEYANGAPGYFTASTVEAGVPFRFQIVGEKGGLELVGNDLHRFTFDQALLDHMRTNPGMWDAPKTTWTKVDVPAGGEGGHADVYLDLADAIGKNRPPRVTGEDARESLELANAIVLSSVIEKPVSLPVDRKAYAGLLDDLKSGKRKLAA